MRAIYTQSSVSVLPVLLRMFFRVKIAVLSTFIVLPSLLFSQTLPLNVINQGLDIRNTNDSIVIFGNVFHDASSSVQDGLIENDGHFYISGDWTNNNNTGGIFAPGHTGWVHLDSAVQTIKGNTMTHWNNLELSGLTDSAKFLVGVDTEIEDTLALNNHEFNAEKFTVYVLSTDTNAITRTTGYVSNTEDGGLARNTAFEATYSFPVGGRIVDTIRFRPVDIKPLTADPNTYKVRMANIDPTNDTDQQFDRDLHEATVGDINKFFYHRLTRINGTSNIDLTVYYDSADAEGVEFDIIAYWEELSEWKNPGPASSALGYGLNRGLRFDGFDKFFPTASTAVALSHNVDIAGDIFVANVFSPNGDGINDFIYARGKALESVEFIIYDRWGVKMFETNDITVGWDGRYKGQALNTAVFVYVVKGKFKNGDETVAKGNFTLLR
jgi:gliding motility-associated-like protein